MYKTNATTEGTPGPHEPWSTDRVWDRVRLFLLYILYCWACSCPGKFRLENE